MRNTLIALAVLAALAAAPAEAARGRKGKSKAAATAPQKSPEAPPRSDPRAADEDGASVDASGKRGPSRIEFDDRLVQGQTNKANAIYLFERRESALRSLLKKRTDFQDEIDEMLE